jgi:hypothetical protein
MTNNDDIEFLLKKHFQQESNYLDDNGFTALVMTQLPHKTQINPWIKRLILWLPVSLVTLLVLSFIPWLQVIHQVYAYYLIASPQDLMLIGIPLAISIILLPTYFLFSENK